MLLEEEIESFLEHIVDDVENFVTEELRVQIKSTKHGLTLTPFHSRQTLVRVGLWNEV